MMMFNEILDYVKRTDDFERSSLNRLAELGNPLALAERVQMVYDDLYDDFDLAARVNDSSVDAIWVRPVT
jgi:hypothetical protein